jgi:hypothetical protein
MKMPTNRKVVDFKIHNLTEEQFQELKAQGKIDPNAVYCTPDDSLKTSQITNCITEIPQDIVLTLSSGTLTLKSGSKVYKPVSGGTFESETTTQDYSVTPSGFSTSTGRIVWKTSSGISVVNVSKDYIFSGTTAPATFSSGRAYWYDTTNNVIK